MNAYCDNGEKYAHYGYDDAGQRMYKMLLNKSEIYTSRYGGTALEVEKLAFFPNGFININQNGEYSKHYYADADRIASKIGTGSVLDKNLCDSLKVADTVLTYLDSAINEKIHNDLKFVTLPEIEVEIDYGDYIICDLQTDTANKYENAVYFYHGSNIASVMMVTDWNGNVSQAIMYAPFGEITQEYNVLWHQDIIPNFGFSAKMLDEESQMYYFEARYLKPPSFISRDVLFEKYFWISPYAYCGNNPLKYVDPTGMDYDPVIDEEAGTITIKATYYTSEENRDKVEAAAKSWNEQSGKYQYTTGTGDNQKTYTVNFDLKVEVYANDKEAEWVFDNVKGNGQANLVKSAEIVRNSNGESVRGLCTEGNKIDVAKSSPLRTTIHEIGHTLGINDGDIGVMVSGGNSDKIRKPHVASILIKAGMQTLGNFGGSTETWEKYGNPTQTYNMIGYFLRNKNSK